MSSTGKWIRGWFCRQRRAKKAKENKRRPSVSQSSGGPEASAKQAPSSTSKPKANPNITVSQISHKSTVKPQVSRQSKIMQPTPVAAATRVRIDICGADKENLTAPTASANDFLDPTPLYAPAKYTFEQQTHKSPAAQLQSGQTFQASVPDIYGVNMSAAHARVTGLPVWAPLPVYASSRHTLVEQAWQRLHSPTAQSPDSVSTSATPLRLPYNKNVLDILTARYPVQDLSDDCAQHNIFCTDNCYHETPSHLSFEGDCLQRSRYQYTGSSHAQSDPFVARFDQLPQNAVT